MTRRRLADLGEQRAQDSDDARAVAGKYPDSTSLDADDYEDDWEYDVGALGEVSFQDDVSDWELGDQELSQEGAEDEGRDGEEEDEQEVGDLELDVEEMGKHGMQDVSTI